MGGQELVAGPLLAVLVLLALLGWAAFARRRHDPERGRTLALALLLTVLATAGNVNAYFGYLPHVADVAGLVTGGGDWPTVSAADLSATGAAHGVAATEATDLGARYPGGGVARLPVPDGGSGTGASDALVWLPPQYFSRTTARFPVVYLLHGSPGVPADWLRGGEASAIAGGLAEHGLPAVVVMPKLSRHWLDDPECVDGARERVETHFWADVVPAVDASLRTVPTRQARTLAGMSAGGYCALNLGLKHRDRVATIVDLSGLTAPTHRGGVDRLYGPGGEQRAALDSPGDYAARLDADPPTRVWLDVGRSDHDVRPGLESLAAVLADRGLEVQLHERPGRHTFRVWRPALSEALTWAVRGMDVDQEPA